MSLGKVTKQTYALIPQDKYVFTLNDLEETTGEWGDALKWVWLISPTDAPNEYLVDSRGEDKTLWQFTNADITIGSRQHEWIQALIHRELGEDDDAPEIAELLGKRMTAFLTHYTPKKGKNAGQKIEKIAEGSALPWRGRQAGPAPLVEAEPSTTPTGAAASTTPDRQELMAEIKKLLRRASIQDLPQVDEWAALDPAAMTVPQLEALKEEVDEALKAGASVA